ncbi:MAG: hypothetical protein ABF524_03655, partial [Bifidobacterium aquikefiri]
MLARVRSLDSLRSLEMTRDAGTVGVTRKADSVGVTMEMGSLEMTFGRGDEGCGFARDDWDDKGGWDGWHRHWVVPAFVVVLRCMMVPQCGHRVAFIPSRSRRIINQ